MDPESKVAVEQSDAKSCWKKAAAADGSLTANLKENWNAFVNTNMDEHKICLKKTMDNFTDYIKLKKEALVSSKPAVEGDSGAKEVASSIPVKTN